MAMLEVEDLNVRFYTEDGVVKATNDLSYEVKAGERFGVVGESGAGKSVTSLAVMRLIDEPGVIESGEIRFKGRNLLELDDEEMRELRGNEIAMIFQDAETALNPAYTVGEQISEAVRHHLDMDEAAASTVVPTLSVAWTMTGAIAFGRMCRTMTDRSLAPSAFAAVTYSFSLTLSISPRRMRA